MYVGSVSIFDDFVTQLLSIKTGLQVMRTMFRNDELFLDEVRKAQPDVMLVNVGDTLDKNHLCEMINSNPALARLRIITVRLGNNMMDIYDGSKKMQARTGKLKSKLLKNSDDLIRAVNGRHRATISLAGSPL